MHSEIFGVYNGTLAKIATVINRERMLELLKGLASSMDELNKHVFGWVDSAAPSLHRARAACGSEFQDGHPLGERVMGTPRRIDLRHAGILDPDLLP